MYKVNDVTNWLSQTTDNSKYFVWSPGLWDKESRLYIHICKSQGKMNVDTFLYNREETVDKSLFWGWNGLVPKLLVYRNILFTETSCLILVKEEKFYY